MFRIASSEFFAHFEIGIGPETSEVLGELYGFETRREEFHENGLPAVVDARRVLHTETFLQTHPEDGLFGSLSIFHFYPAASRHRNVGRCEPVHLLLLLVREE